MQPDTPCHCARPASWETEMWKKKKGKRKEKRLQKRATYEEYMFREVALFLIKFMLPAKTKIKNKEQKKEN